MELGNKNTLLPNFVLGKDNGLVTNDPFTKSPCYTDWKKAFKATCCYVLRNE